jgi:regulator of sigma E protease
MITALAFIGVMLLLIVVHELGHFAVARWYGVDVTAFSVGFGPKIARVVRGGTEYAIRAIPLGGFVRLAGSGLASGPATSPGDFRSRSRWVRGQIYAAGPVANLALAVVLKVVVFSFATPSLAATEPGGRLLVGGVAPSSDAEHAGFRANDVVVGVGEACVTDWPGAAAMVAEAGPRPVRFDIERGGRVMEASLTGGRDLHDLGLVSLRYLPLDVALASDLAPPDHAWSRAPATITAAIGDAASDTVAITSGVAALASGHEPVSGLVGPIGIAQMSGRAAAEGWVTLVELMALVSLGLAVLNLLPIPVLDGGQIAVLAVEGVLRRDFGMAVRVALAVVGVVALVSLMVVATYNDVMRLVG